MFAWSNIFINNFRFHFYLILYVSFKLLPLKRVAVKC